MDKAKIIKWKFILLLIPVIIFVITMRTPMTFRAVPKPCGVLHTCPFQISEQTITPLNNTKHLLVSAYADQRVTGFDIRIIGIFRRDSIQLLHCLFCCSGYFSGSTPATISQHSDNFSFAFTTTDIMCQIPQHCNATHVTLLTQADEKKMSDQIWLPIRNKKTNEKEDERLHFNFTVCISNLFGDYNNVLQFAQTLEMYRSAQQHRKPLCHANRTMPQWRGVPGFNILEHIYRKEPDRTINHPYKMIVKPRAVEQTSVHDVLKMFGQKFKVPLDICRIIHSPISMPRQPLLEQLHVDTRLWDFKDRMLPNVITVLRRAGLLKSEE
uniref:uncharacterized protein LOC109953386 n=1 Tax=Monopterus albus TaxID=43700 RepID=UPI0009B42F1A|nr:uncharacterized protein LOC109953386 [Monopterus albus]